MFRSITPESAGVSSARVSALLDRLERRGLNMHSLLLLRGDDLFFEGYWKPFDRDFCHRMYSQTKSFVGVAIGLLEEEGRLCLDDPIVSFFPDKLDAPPHPLLARQTVRQMLTMTTVGNPRAYWFRSPDPDRVHLYLNDDRGGRMHPPGTVWEYDSAGSQVLASLVERLSGMPLLSYLRKKLFDRMGTFRTAEILQTKNNDSWGDSAMVCTPRDMASFGRLVMQYGVYNGERLMNERYLREATSPRVSNKVSGWDSYAAHGYGYQIWCTEQGGFSFNGMGGQFTIALPDRDFLFVCTADNQGYAQAHEVLFEALFEEIVDSMRDTPLPENTSAYAALTARAADLHMRTADGAVTSPRAAQINDAVFRCIDNPMGWRSFSLHFGEDGQGVLRYQNEQGEKELFFGMGKTVLGLFPEDGYSDGHGGLPGPAGFRYRCGASAGWVDPDRLLLRVFIIDRYFGNLSIHFAFRDNEVCAYMVPAAEAFLEKYNGYIIGTAVAH